jgi:hypothetical protein
VGPLQRRYHIVCAAAAVAQIVTVWLTWHLWAHRSAPPNLPLADWLSAIPWGWPLLVLCVLCAVRPRWGGPAFAVALLLACLGDQMRLQPEVLSIAVLMVAPAYGGNGRSIARWHLCSLWLWAGVHKFLSRGWAAAGGGADFIVQAYGHPGWLWVVVIALPLCQIGLGVTALWPRLWKLTGVGAPLLHTGVLVTLSPLIADWNSAVLPWNAAVAVCAPLLFLSQRDAAFPSRAVIGVAAVLLAYPALFYVKVMDAYPSHNLYSTNVATAKVCPNGGEKCSTKMFDTWDELNVPVPPEPRLYRQSFEKQCRPGDELVITGIQTWITGSPSEDRQTCSRLESP